MFNWSEVHFFGSTSYEIHTLGIHIWLLFIKGIWQLKFSIYINFFMFLNSWDSFANGKICRTVQLILIFVEPLFHLLKEKISQINQGHFAKSTTYLGIWKSFSAKVLKTEKEKNGLGKEAIFYLFLQSKQIEKKKKNLAVGTIIVLETLMHFIW